MNEPFCYNCGKEQSYTYVFPIDEKLKKTWGISENLSRVFNRREGSICNHCGVNARGQGLAKAILQSKIGYGKASLEEWVSVANKKKIAVCELNACHELHKTLTKLKYLTYAEYGTSTEQNIENMSYPDNTFDLVVHSETLEHVSNPKKAMDECRRVIKPTGEVLFTTPVIWNRKTRKRAYIKGNKVVRILDASYHGKQADDYLVFYEYGRDIDKILGAKIAYRNWKNQNYVFSSGKIPYKIHLVQKSRALVLEKIAQHRKA